MQAMRRCSTVPQLAGRLSVGRTVEGRMGEPPAQQIAPVSAIAATLTDYSARVHWSGLTRGRGVNLSRVSHRRRLEAAEERGDWVGATAFGARLRSGSTQLL